MKIDDKILGERIQLRELTSADATEHYLEWLLDEDVTHYLEGRFAPPADTEELRSYIESINSSADTLLLGMFLSDGNRHIGNIKLGPINPHHQYADIGLVIGDKDNWGKGHAAEAISLLSDYAFSALGLNKLTAACYEGNASSLRAFKKAGFAEEGRQASQLVSGRTREDRILLGKVRPSKKNAVAAILQARISSSRLPGKVVMPILGRPMLALQIERIKRAKRINRLIVATSNQADDDVIAELCESLDTPCFRGSLDDVLDRYYQAAATSGAETIVRLTGDCPLLDPVIIDECIDFFEYGSYDYATNAIEATYPDGLDVEVMRFECLEQAWKEARLPSEREHVTPFINCKPDRFRIGHLHGRTDLSHMRWTVDEPEDFKFVEFVFAALYPGNPQFSTQDILDLIEAHPDLPKLNDRFSRNEGLAKSRKLDEAWLVGSQRHFDQSELLLERALKTIPLGSQTFSKSKTQFPHGVSPYFIRRGQGSHVWDVDGNQYVDFINGLASITLGYSDPDVNAAVLRQMRDGVIFSLPHPIEMEVAEKLVEMVPSADMVRFGKNGSDATSGAIRLARAWTKRDRVAVCGYHGWQDWYIGSTARNRGIPQAVRSLTHTFPYNDIEALEQLLSKHKEEFAAVILEPMNTTEPLPGYLAAVKELAHRHGALLIFDETVTGFRFANGGAQEYFGVFPDLATFGKGLANGYPVSAIAGRADVMKLMEEVFFSFTFGGEALSLAAALATMTKLQQQPVIETLRRQGKKIVDGVRSRIGRHGVQDFLDILGNPVWSFVIFRDAGPYTQWQLKTLFMQEMLARGILTIGTHNVSYAHGDTEIANLLDAYDEVLPILAVAVRDRKLEAMLRCQPLEPLFKIR